MDTEFSTISDSELLAGFKKCSPKTGDRLVLYAEIKKRGLLGEIDDNDCLLFRGRARTSPETFWFIIGAVIICTICRHLERSEAIVLTLWFLTLLILLSCLNLVFYRIILVYPNRVSIDTCLFFHWLRLKKRAIRFLESGLYINTYSYRHPILSWLLSPMGFFYLRPVPNILPRLRCDLYLKEAIKLLPQLQIFFEAIEQSVFIESNSPEIPLLSIASQTDLKTFCQRLTGFVDKPVSRADINWLRLIATVCNKDIPEGIKNNPLSAPPKWLMPEEHLVMYRRAPLGGFLNIGYLWLTNYRIVWATLSGEYVNGTTYNSELLKPAPYKMTKGLVWLIQFEGKMASPTAASPYPIPSIFTYFTNKG